MNKLLICKRDKTIVSGFVEKELKRINYALLPRIIIRLCLLYYCPKDEWSILLCDNIIQISGDIVTRLSADLFQDIGYKSVFLKNVVSSGIHVWQFRIRNCTYFDLGIASTTQLMDSTLICYGFSSRHGQKGIHYHSFGVNKFCIVDDLYTYVEAFYLIAMIYKHNITMIPISKQISFQSQFQLRILLPINKFYPYHFHAFHLNVNICTQEICFG